MDKYSCYRELAESEKEGTDFKRIAQPINGALVAVIAPHAGGIEPETGTIARAIAGDDFSLYCFRGCKKNGNGELHIKSHCFDEPECVKLVAGHKMVVAIHGCKVAGERVFLGGLDEALITELAANLNQAGIVAETSEHKYAGKHPNNICNRGSEKAGVQFELSHSFRRGIHVHEFTKVVRSVLLARQNAV
jgi:phage replication-related protein YjqB (UPF0714/DUF867 family)